MTVLKCNAKDPNTCRYHRPNAGYIELQRWQKAEKVASIMLEKANRLQDDSAYNKFLEARAEADEAQEVYYATPDGYAKLEEEIAIVEDPSVLHTLKLQKDISLYYLQEAERRNLIDSEYGGTLKPHPDSHYVIPTIEHGGDAYWPTSKGSKYDSSLKVGQIKTKLNADIKDAIKNGYLPAHVKYIVTARDRRLTVTIANVADEQLYNVPEEKRWGDFTPDAQELKARVSTLVNAYNSTQYDTLEGRRNLTHFWESIDFEDDWRRDFRMKKEAEKDQRRKKTV